MKVFHLVSFLFFFELLCCGGSWCWSQSTASSPSSSALPSPWEKILQLGLTPLDQEGSSFQLPVLDLQQQSREMGLEDWKGSWVLLVFWATWCGPCQMELPSLENLWKELQGNPQNRLLVVGVSIDQGNPRPVLRFMQEKNITFPILHDSAGQVASQYGAHAVPTLFLLSPQGKVAGVFQGAQQWHSPSIVASLKEIASMESLPILPEDVKKEMLSSAASGVSGAQERPLLPTSLTPPRPKLSWANESNHMLRLEVEWEGDKDQYVILAPKIILPEGVTHSPFSVSSSARDMNHTIIYEASLQFSKPGIFDIGPIELGFKSARRLEKELYAQSNKLEVRILPWWQKSFILWIIGGSIILLTGAGLSLFLVRAKEKKKERESLGLDQQREMATWDSLWQKTQKMRSDAESWQLLEQYLVLFQFLESHARQMTSSQEWDDLVIEKQKLKEKRDSVRYGGDHLSEDYAQMIERKIQRVVKKIGYLIGEDHHGV